MVIQITAGVALIVVLVAVFFRVTKTRKKEPLPQAAPRYIYRCRGPLYPRKEEVLDGLSVFDSPERLLAHAWIHKKDGESFFTIDTDRPSLLEAGYSDVTLASQDSSSEHASAHAHKSNAEPAFTEGTEAPALPIELDEYPKGEKSKWIGQVEMLIERDKAGDPEALKSLIQWGKGCTWPGGRKASEYLLSVGRRVYPLVLDVLKTQDDEWRYRVITGLVYNWPRELQKEIAPVLETLTYEPSDDKWNLEVDVAAAEILCENNLVDRGQRKAIIERVVRNNPQLKDDDVAALEACAD